MNRRLLAAVILGAILGVICIIGGGARAGGWTGNEVYLIAMWYNRVLIGLLIGLSGRWEPLPGPTNRYLRGLLLGIAVSLAFFLTTGFRDVIAFVAGGIYGVVIEYGVRKHAP
jgi:hypothetical protein